MSQGPTEFNFRTKNLLGRLQFSVFGVRAVVFHRTTHNKFYGFETLLLDQVGAMYRFDHVLKQITESIIVHGPELVIGASDVEVDVAHVQADALLQHRLKELTQEVEGDAVTWLSSEETVLFRHEMVGVEHVKAARCPQIVKMTHVSR